MSNRQNLETQQRTQTPTDSYLTKAEVSARLRKTPRTVERWMRQGIVPYAKIGRGKRATVLFRWPDIERHIQARFGVGGAN